VKLLAGNLLMKIDNLSPGRYRYAKKFAMKAFMQAEQFFWSNVFTDESFKDAIWTSTSLASCLLSVLMEGISEADDKTAASHARFNSLVEACGSVITRPTGQW
jgi:hypothetical protein